MTSTGLASNLKANSSENYISFCQNKCVYSDADSSDTEAVCLLPAVSTMYSDTNKGINKKGVIKPFLTTSSGTTHANLFDGNLNNMNEDMSADCDITMEF